MLEPQPQGWELFCTCTSSSEITGGARLHRPWSTDREGTPWGQDRCPELSVCSQGRELRFPALPWKSRARRDCICSSLKRKGRDSSDLSALRVAGMKFPKPSLGAENKLFPRFRLGLCQWNRAKATAAFGGMVNYNQSVNGLDW